MASAPPLFHLGPGFRRGNRVEGYSYSLSSASSLRCSGFITQ